MEKPRCDLCGAEEIDLLCISDPWEQLTGLPVKLVRCKQCGLIYLSPRPTQDEIGNYYTEDYPCYQKAVEDETHWLMRWMRERKLKRRRQMVEKYADRKNGRILDVGSSTGLFLNEMKRSGWETNGVEPNIGASDYARHRFGLDIFCGNLELATFDAKSFDAITYWDVLEHTPSPLAELRKAAWLLKPGGIIAINIPNWNSVDRQLFGPYWIGYDPPRHFYHFTPEVMTKILNQCGFEVLDWVCFFPSYFSFALSLERWLIGHNSKFVRPVIAILSIPGIRLIFEPLFTILNFFRKAGVISVFAQINRE